MHTDNSRYQPQITYSLRLPLKNLFEPAYRGQPLLAIVGTFMLCAILPTALAMGLDERTLNGVSVWLKPLKFEASLAVHLLTLSWLMIFIPETERRGLIVKALVAVILATALFEIAYIALQASTGEASHFNLTTRTTRLMYSLMGIAAVALLVATGCIGLLVLRHGDVHDPVAFAAGLGLVLGSVLGATTGLYMGGQPGHWVGGSVSDANGLPIVGWSRTGGDLRVAHFVWLHAIQALPLTAWVFAGRITAERGKTIVYITAILLAAVTGIVFTQARLGLPLIPA